MSTPIGVSLPGIGVSIASANVALSSTAVDLPAYGVSLFGIGVSLSSTATQTSGPPGIPQVVFNNATGSMYIAILGRFA